MGPSSQVLAQMGDKLSAKEIAIKCGVPIIPGCTEPLKDADDALEKAVSFGFPIILKAAAGGGRSRHAPLRQTRGGQDRL